MDTRIFFLLAMLRLLNSSAVCDGEAGVFFGGNAYWEESPVFIEAARRRRPWCLLHVIQLTKSTSWHEIARRRWMGVRLRR